MLKHLKEDTGQGDWPVVCWLSLIPFFEDRIYNGFFPDIVGSFPVSRNF